MLEFRIQVPHRRVVGEKRDDDDRSVGRKKVAFDNDHGNAIVLRDVKAGQAIHDDPPGAVMMSASGCP
jgi:hypothetical protein